MYDLAGQLLGAEKWSTGGTPTVPSRYAYAYDPGGNRTSEQIDDQVTGASYDSLNRLVSRQASGPLVFAGTTNEPAAVTVQGKPAVSTAGNGFRAPATVTSGTSTVTVTATDPSGNVTTQAYEVDSVGTGRTFTYDANGNLTSDGTRTFEWDTRNQLVAVNRRRPLVSSARARTEVLRALLPSGEEAMARGRAVLQRIDLVRVNDRILNADGVLRPSLLRALDAIHLATVQELGEDLRALITTYDDRMVAAATGLGYKVAQPR